jgi:hypothetical protein
MVIYVEAGHSQHLAIHSSWVMVSAPSRASSSPARSVLATAVRARTARVCEGLDPELGPVAQPAGGCPEEHEIVDAPELRRG